MSFKGENFTKQQQQQQQQLNKQMKEQKVAIDELSNLKKNRKVFVQQANSNVFFLAEKAETLSSCRKNLEKMKKEHQDM